MTAGGQGQGYTIAAGVNGLMKAEGGEELDYDSRRAGAGIYHGSRREGLDEGRRRGGTRLRQQEGRGRAIPWQPEGRA